MKPPIADPFADIPAGEPTSTFHYGFWKTYWCCFLGILAVAGPLYLSLWMGMAGSHHSSQGLSRQNSFSLVMLGVFTVTPFLAVSCYFLFPVKTSERVLQCTNLWSAWREVKWSEIHHVKFFWLFLPYAVISTEQKRNFIWMPLVLKDMSGLTREVEKHTTAENPLRLFLQKRGY